MNVIGLLTGRGNNTLIDKNIMPVLGKPLISYPAIEASKVINQNNLYVSSDDNKILKAVSKYGFKPIVRPIEISGPEAQHIDAIRHAVEFIKNDLKANIDVIVVMLANSATIKAEWIQQAIGIITNDRSVSAVVPAYIEQDHHPFRAKKLDDNGFLVPYFDFGYEHISTNRQDLPDNYFLSHNFWVLNVSKSLDCNDGLKPWSFMGKNVKPIIVNGCFDVHTIDDIKRTEEWLIKNGK